MPTLNKMNFLRLLDQSRAEENLCDVEFRVVDPVNKPLGTVGLPPGVFKPLELLCRGGHRHLQIGRMLDIDLISELSN